MAIHLRTAGWTGVHSAGRGPRPAIVLLATGAVALMAGVVLLAASLAPLVGIGPETATIDLIQAAPVMAPGPSLGDMTVPTTLDRPIDGVAFTMRVPALGYSATVYEGTDEKTLLRGPGHYPSSGWPGHPGNVGIAAHNVYWLSFSRLNAGDRVELQTHTGLFLYAITGSKVTQPDDRNVITPTSEHRLTLTTCYPLWAGALATSRLVFFARELGGVA